MRTHQQQYQEQSLFYKKHSSMKFASKFRFIYQQQTYFMSTSQREYEQHNTFQYIEKHREFEIACFFYFEYTHMYKPTRTS